MADIRTGTVSIHGKEYPVAVINGERFINGKTVDEFLASISSDAQDDMAIIGFKLMRGDTMESIQTEADLLYIEGE